MMENDQSERLKLQIVNQAFNGYVRTFSIQNEEYIDIREFLNDAFHLHKSELLVILNEYNMVKTSCCLIVEFEKTIASTAAVSAGNDDNDDEVDGERLIKQTFYFWTDHIIIASGEDFDRQYQKHVVGEILKNVDEAAVEGSGFTLSRIISLDIQACSYSPLRGSSYIPTPAKVNSKVAVVNVQNKHDEKCFMWAILSAIHTVKKNPQRLTHYLQYQNELNFDGICFPVRLQDIDKFTRQNSTISINVYYYDDEEDSVYPLRVSGEVKERHIHLLLIVDGVNMSRVSRVHTTATKIRKMVENGCIRTHYCWIKNLSRLISRQQSKHGHKIHICDRCLNFFNNEDALAKHKAYCTNECQIEMPSEAAKWIQFNHFEYQLKSPFVIYADTEAYLKQLSLNEQHQVFNKNCCTNVYQNHRIYAVGYYFKCEFDESFSFYASSGNSVDCVDWFMKELEFIAGKVAKSLLYNHRMNELTADEKRSLKDPDAICFICKRKFEVYELRAREHCHFTGNNNSFI